MNVPSSLPEDFIQRVTALVTADSWDEIAVLCDPVREDEAGFGEAAFLSSIAAYRDEDFVKAIAKGESAFAANPQVSEFAAWLAALYVLVGNFPKSMFFQKMAGVVPSDPKVKGWMPVSLPTFSETFLNIEEMPLFQRAVKALAWNRWAEAEDWFRQHVAFEPRHRDGYLGLARCQIARGRFQRAVQTLRAAVHLLPDEAEIVSLLGSALTSVGRFREASAVGRWACSLAPQDIEVGAAALRSGLSDPYLEVATLVEATRKWSESFAARAGIYGPAPKPRQKARLTIGYLLGWIGRKNEGPALAAILARRDSQRFRAVGFGEGLLSDPSNLVFQKAVDAWHDIRDTDAYTLASMVAAEDVDILIDLSGLSTPSLLAGLGGRMAPIQVLWAGMPLGTGMASIDGLLTDHALDPEGAASPVTEALVRLPLGAVLAELPPADMPMAVGDPERPTTFATDASQAELTPETVETWARILHEIPDSVLLLRDHDFQDPSNSERLLELFGTFGVAHRVDVVDAPANEIYAQADVALLPLHTDRIETAVDALWVGLPVVGLAAKGRHWREVASLLVNSGVGAETLAPDEDAYRQMAVGWAKDAARRATFREGIRARLEASPLFDVARRAADLESTLSALWERACGNPG